MRDKNYTEEQQKHSQPFIYFWLSLRRRQIWHPSKTEIRNIYETLFNQCKCNTMFMHTKYNTWLPRNHMQTIYSVFFLNFTQILVPLTGTFSMQMHTIYTAGYTSDSRLVEGLKINANTVFIHHAGWLAMNALTPRQIQLWEHRM